MPHQCTGCGERFADGSKEMLSGCPECGGNKFQFRPQGADVPGEPEEPEPPKPADDPQEPSVAETVGRATTRVRDFVSGADEPDPNAAWPDEPGAAGDDRVVSEPSDEDPDLAELREQLNDQFESIKIVEPGQYELNLMELYDREEYIIALQENGRYVIQVPDQWIGADVDDR